MTSINLSEFVSNKSQVISGASTISTTRDGLNALSSANGLAIGRVYLITDESRLAIATSQSSYETFVKETEVGNIISKNITVGTSAPSSPQIGDLWVDTN